MVLPQCFQVGFHTAAGELIYHWDAAGKGLAGLGKGAGPNTTASVGLNTPVSYVHRGANNTCTKIGRRLNDAH